MPDWTESQYAEAKSLYENGEFDDPEIRTKLESAIAKYEARSIPAEAAGEAPKDPPEKGFGARFIEGAKGLAEGAMSVAGEAAKMELPSGPMPESSDEPDDGVGYGDPTVDEIIAQDKFTEAKLAEEESLKDRTLDNRSKLPSLKASAVYMPPQQPMSTAPAFGRDIIGAQVKPFAHHDPSPQYVESVLRAGGHHADADSVQALGEEAPEYQKFTDLQWIKVRGAFEKKGVPVKRVDMLEGGGGESFAAGMTDSITLGGASELPFSPTREHQKVLEYLEETGVYPDRETRMEDLANKHTAANIGGRMAGAVNPFGVAGQLGRALSFGPGLVRGALGASVGAGVERTGELGVEAGVRGATGKDQRDLKDAAMDVGGSALAGGLFGGALGGVGTLARRGMAKFRGQVAGTKTNRSIDVNRMEDVGGSTKVMSMAGMDMGDDLRKFSGEMSERFSKALDEPTDGKARGNTERAAASSVGERLAKTGKEMYETTSKWIEAENEAFYATPAGRTKIAPEKTVRELIRMAKSKGSGIFQNDAAMREMIEDAIPPRFAFHGQDFRAAKDGGEITLRSDELEALGMMDKAVAAYSEAKSIPEDHARWILSMSPEEGGVIVAVKPTRMNARGFQETMGALEARIATEKLRGWGRVKEAIYEDRVGFGEYEEGKLWADLKREHYQALSEIEEAGKILGSRGGKFAEMDNPARPAQFLSRVADAVGYYGNDDNQSRALRGLLTADPKAAEELKKFMGLRAYNRLAGTSEFNALKAGPAASTAQNITEAVGYLPMALDAIRRKLSGAEQAVQRTGAIPAAVNATGPETAPLTEEDLRRRSYMQGAIQQ